jgi:hypothetical protein
MNKNLSDLRGVGNLEGFAIFLWKQELNYGRNAPFIKTNYFL